MAGKGDQAKWKYKSKTVPIVLTRDDDDAFSLALQTVNGTDAWSNTYYGFPDPQPDNVHFFYTELDAQQECYLEATVLVAPTAGTGRYDQAGLLVRVSPRCWLKASIEYIPDAASHWGSVCTNNGWSDWATQDMTPLSMPSQADFTASATPSSKDAHFFLKAQQGAPITAAQYRVHRLRHGDYVVEGRLCDVHVVPVPLPGMQTAGSSSSRDGSAEGKEEQAVPWTQLRMCHLVEDPWASQHPACGAAGSGQRPPAGTESATVQIGVYACSPLGPGCQAYFKDVKLHEGRIYPVPH